jgi:hypothetical protein
MRKIHLRILLGLVRDEFAFKLTDSWQFVSFTMRGLRSAKKAPHGGNNLASEQQAKKSSDLTTPISATLADKSTGNYKIVATPATDPQINASGSEGPGRKTKRSARAATLDPILETPSRPEVLIATPTASVARKATKKARKASPGDENGAILAIRAPEANVVQEPTAIEPPAQAIAALNEEELCSEMRKGIFNLKEILDGYGEAIENVEELDNDSLSLTKCFCACAEKVRNIVFKRNGWDQQNASWLKEGFRKPCKFVALPRADRPTCDGCRIFLDGGLDIASLVLYTLVLSLIFVYQLEGADHNDNDGFADSTAFLAAARY